MDDGKLWHRRQHEVAHTALVAAIQARRSLAHNRSFQFLVEAI
jgi:hypothetical protein